MLFRNTCRVFQRNTGRSVGLNVRPQSTNSRPGYQPQDEAIDFRPPWVYVGSRLLTFTIIPGIVFYSVFIYDFGERDHVFQPVRRWALEQKAAFLTLSPDEERILNANETKSETS
ncbi:hypothetical protein D9756_004805 [Leucocoprinus leucothites]|uniref:Uncharacterized protein n=1 Tax=Leucocoprinus leucothites TaxID=201217 RepID=A0A8H5G9T3_9AGAR|nr:hypothetical protein D9756_004805 [Leucoagaricus leucothites]